MKILKNKYFILGNIALILAVIPVTLFFISRQQDVRSRAAPTTKISFVPATLSFEGELCTEQTVKVRLDPGENIVATVELFLTYDATKFNISISPNEEVFPEILKGPTVANGQASVFMNIGSSVTNAIQTPVDIATITIVPIAGTGDSTANISIDSSKTRVFALSEDENSAAEDVFLSGEQAAISIDAACITDEPGTSPSPSTTVSPSPTGGGGNPTPTTNPGTSPSPSAGAGQAPVCSTLAASPANSGSAPFVLTLSAQGSDTNGTISKATFNFGDGTIQDVIEGLGTAAVTTQLAHTYPTAGSYSATVIFTDNSGAVSSTCNTNITVLATSTTAPTPTTTAEGIQPTSTTAPTPTIENPGGMGTTLAVIGGIILVILGGIALIAL